MGRAAAPLVGVIMGSKSDYQQMAATCQVLNELKVSHELRVLSAHRTLTLTLQYAASAEGRGLKAIIAGAGGAAHLPGVIAAATRVPVIGVPIPIEPLGGLDSLLSMVQMPSGVPVATMAIGKAGAANAGLFAAEIIALSDHELKTRLARWRSSRAREVGRQKLP